MVSNKIIPNKSTMNKDTEIRIYVLGNETIEVYVHIYTFRYNI